MNQFNIGTITVAIGLAFSAGAMAQSMSKDEYRAGKDGISAEYKSAKANCSSFSGNVKDRCKAEARGNEKTAQAELEFRYKPTDKARYEARVAKAQADYSVAKEQCDDKAGNVKDVCLKEAKAAQIAAKADAKAQMKISDANKVANQQSSAAHMKADEKAADANKVANQQSRAAHMKADEKAADANKTANRKSSAAHIRANEKAVEARRDAAADKRDADFAVAKEKCDVYSGDAKDLCMREAKAQFGKS